MICLLIVTSHSEDWGQGSSFSELTLYKYCCAIFMVQWLYSYFSLISSPREWLFEYTSRPCTHKLKFYWCSATNQQDYSISRRTGSASASGWTYSSYSQALSRQNRNYPLLMVEPQTTLPSVLRTKTLYFLPSWPDPRLMKYSPLEGTLRVTTTKWFCRQDSGMCLTGSSSWFTTVSFLNRCRMGLQYLKCGDFERWSISQEYPVFSSTPNIFICDSDSSSLALSSSALPSYLRTSLNSISSRLSLTLKVLIGQENRVCRIYGKHFDLVWLSSRCSSSQPSPSWGSCASLLCRTREDYYSLRGERESWIYSYFPKLNLVPMYQTKCSSLVVQVNKSSQSYRSRKQSMVCLNGYGIVLQSKQLGVVLTCPKNCLRVGIREPFCRVGYLSARKYYVLRLTVARRLT